MSAFDTFQFFSGGGNCSVSGSTLTIVSRALYRSGCTQTQQSCILATLLFPTPSTSCWTSATTPATNGAYAPVFANCTVSTSTNITVGAFFDQSSVNSNLPYFVYSTYDDAACEKWSAKALRVQHLTAFVAGSRCIQRDPATTPHSTPPLTATTLPKPFPSVTTATPPAPAAPLAPNLPYYQCIRNPFDPQTYISGYCTVANSLDMPALPNPLFTLPPPLLLRLLPLRSYHHL
ncbi:hypothetical protein BC829DRAFT_491001 [Chytridium lagenaria]|nr:hypothetical protein BC829DRAFT_491001 [Chytridium lagenaria]